jgi:hypothetical protein
MGADAEVSLPLSLQAASKSEIVATAMPGNTENTEKMLAPDMRLSI